MYYNVILEVLLKNLTADLIKTRSVFIDTLDYNH